MNINYPIKLSDLLKMNCDDNRLITKDNLDKVYGIIYRIYCLIEKKSYVGQTCSHSYSEDYLQPRNIIYRCKQHYKTIKLEKYKENPFARDLIKYGSENFVVYELERLYGKDIVKLNRIEGEYIAKYNCVENGYNSERVGKIFPKILTVMCEYYGVDIERIEYI